MSTRKAIEVSSFDWFGGIPIPSIVDDPDTMRRKVASPVSDKWRDMKPPKGHSLVHLAAMGTYEGVGSNQNGDAFERWFLKTAHPTFVTDAHLFRDHRSFYKTASGDMFEDPELRQGSVVDSYLWEPMERVELLVAARHDKCADWLGEIERGDMVPFSMGFDCDHDVCSRCEHKAYNPPKDYCQHVRKNASRPYGMNAILPDGSKCFVFNRAGKFKDISKVGVGADMTAFHIRKVAAAAEGTMGGAELALLYAEANGSFGNPLRNAILRKLSAAEKRVSSMGVVLSGPDDDILPPHVADSLSRAGSPEKSTAWMAERGIVLGPRDFMKVAMAGGADPVDCDAVANKIASGGFSWAESRGLDGSIASNYRWEPSRGSGITRLPIHHGDERALVDASASRSLLGGCLKTAAAGRAPASGDLTPSQEVLAVEYLSYKLSAACRLMEEGGEGAAMSVL